jgi:probable rRNA maturation factor
MNAPAPLLLVRFGLESSLPRDESREPPLAGLLDFAYRRERKKPASLDLLFADDAVMSRLNRRHLGKDEPTDVLSFDDGEPDDDGRLRLGDLAVGLETARRTAAERGISFEAEVAFYALHGLLHLLGRRDDDDGERAAMLAEQLGIMREYGLDAPEEMVRE